jgi:hypothetical protein
LSECGGKKIYFRWKEDVCRFIKEHWNLLLPYRTPTSAWMNSVSSVLSSHCPSVFLSGVGELRESGWWKLNPAVLNEGDGSKDKFPDCDLSRGTRGEKRLRPPYSIDERSTDVQMSDAANESARGSKRQAIACTVAEQNQKMQAKVNEVCTLSVKSVKESDLMSVRRPIFCPTKNECLQVMKPREERNLLCQLKTCTDAGLSCVMKTRLNRLIRKLEVRQLKRAHGIPLLSLDVQIAEAINRKQTDKCDSPLQSKIYMPMSMTQTHPVLDRMLIYGDNGSLPVTFVHRLIGAGDLIAMQDFVSPYTESLCVCLSCFCAELYLVVLESLHPSIRLDTI